MSIEKKELKCANSTCKKEFGFFCYKYECPECKHHFCSTCLDFALITEKEAKNGYNAAVQSFCQGCFRKLVNIDMSVEYDFFGTEVGEQPAVVFVHGGGGCRKMFVDHAKDISKTHNLNCICLDLPGHGSKMNDKLSLSTAIDTIVQVTKNMAPECNGIKPAYVGGSLGGYIGMELLGQHPDLFGCAVITMCGQNVGVNRSLIATVGLGFLGFASGMMSAKMMMGAMMGEAKKNGHISEKVLLESTMRCGLYFHQSSEQIKLLKESNPVASLPKYTGKILFINGSTDHRDSEHIWLEASKKGKLIDYDKGDHFFSHDDRFYKTFLTDMSTFILESQK